MSSRRTPNSTASSRSGLPSAWRPGSFRSLKFALAQPRATFADEDLYPSLAEKASALGFSLILNHPFVDGNKRIGHAAVEVFLVLNGFELSAGIDDAERVILGVAAGTISRDEFTKWIRESLVAFPAP